MSKKNSIRRLLSRVLIFASVILLLITLPLGVVIGFIGLIAGCWQRECANQEESDWGLISHVPPEIKWSAPASMPENLIQKIENPQQKKDQSHE